MKTWLSLLLVVQVISVARAQAEPLDIDQCLNDIKKVEAGVSCLFASSNSECAKNSRAVFANPSAQAKDFWRDPLPGAYDSKNMIKNTNSFRIDGGQSWLDYVPWAYQIGLTPSSYLVDAALVARFGVMAGGALSWTVYLAASYFPDKGIPYLCGLHTDAGKLAASPLCSKSILRPPVFQILALAPEERAKALNDTSSSIYWNRFVLCRKYFGTLARNLEHVFSRKIESCSAPAPETRPDGKTVTVQHLKMDGRDHVIEDFAIHWETPNNALLYHVIGAKTPENRRPFRQMSMLYTPSFRAERTAFALRDNYSPALEIEQDIVMDVPPTDEHTILWLNRARIYDACNLPVID